MTTSGIAELSEKEGQLTEQKLEKMISKSHCENQSKGWRPHQQILAVMRRERKKVGLEIRKKNRDRKLEWT